MNCSYHHQHQHQYCSMTLHENAILIPRKRVTSYHRHHQLIPWNSLLLGNVLVLEFRHSPTRRMTCSFHNNHNYNTNLRQSHLLKRQAKNGGKFTPTNPKTSRMISALSVAHPWDHDTRQTHPAVARRRPSLLLLLLLRQRQRPTMECPEMLCTNISCPSQEHRNNTNSNHNKHSHLLP